MFASVEEYSVFPMRPPLKKERKKRGKASQVVNFASVFGGSTIRASCVRGGEIKTNDIVLGSERSVVMKLLGILLRTEFHLEFCFT